MKIYSKEELKDSRIFFDKEPINFLKIVGYFVLGFITIGIVFLSCLPKNYIVKAQGTIEASDKQYVTPLKNADVVEIHFQEGDKVKQGDLLLTLSTGAEGIEEKEITNKIKEAEEKKKIFDMFEQSLNDKQNLLKNEGREQEYYGKVEYYLTQLEDDKKKNDSIEEELLTAQKEMDLLKLELVTIEQEEYDKYLKDYGRKNQDLEDTKEKRLNIESQLAKIDTQSKTQASSSISESSKMVDRETLLSEIEALDEESKTLRREIEDLIDTYEEALKEKTNGKNDEIKNKQQEINTLTLQNNQQAVSTYQQLISELGTARSQNDEKIRELQGQRNVKSTDTNLLKLTASKEGVIHYLTPLKKGLGLQAYQPIAQIDNGKNADLIVECFISAQDRSKIHLGDTSKIAVSGVNQTKFGLIKGKIISIGSGTISQSTTSGSSELFYQVIIELKDTILKSGKDSVSVEASMPVVANIVYEKETYFEWILEQLNLKKEL